MALIEAYRGLDRVTCACSGPTGGHLRWRWRADTFVTCTCTLTDMALSLREYTCILDTCYVSEHFAGVIVIDKLMVR